MFTQKRWTLALLMTALLACAKSETPTTNNAGDSAAKKQSPKPEKSLVVYSGRSAKLVDPLFAQFEKQTGIKVKVRNGKSDTLANRIAMEGEKTEADLIYLQESGYLEALGKKALLAPLADGLVQDVAAAYRGTDNYWVGVSGRARVLVYSTESVKLEELPNIEKSAQFFCPLV